MQESLAVLNMLLPLFLALLVVATPVVVTIAWLARLMIDRHTSLREWFIFTAYCGAVVFLANAGFHILFDGG